MISSNPMITWISVCIWRAQLFCLEVLSALELSLYFVAHQGIVIWVHTKLFRVIS